MVAGGCAWLQGVCVWLLGSMHGYGGACMVTRGMHGEAVCMAKRGHAM